MMYATCSQIQKKNVCILMHIQRKRDACDKTDEVKGLQ